MLSDEEKEAIETIKFFKEMKWYSHAFDNGTEILSEDEKKDVDIVLNLIKKQSKEIEELENQRQNGTLSDGYHTYNDLYYQRCVLFATICNLNKNISWKSKKHNDGEKCFNSDEWFIVGIDTPKGSYTYHYEIKYWDMFEVQELEKGKFWDGHTEKDVTRLLSLIDNNISKDKIKARIKELEEYLYKGNIKDDFLMIRIKAKIQELQSLLEKE